MTSLLWRRGERSTWASRRATACLRQLLRNPLGIAGGVLLLLVVLAAVFAPLLAPYSPTQVHFDAPFQRPLTVGYPLGTDDLGRDVLSRIVYATRASLWWAARGAARRRRGHAAGAGRGVLAVAGRDRLPARRT